MREIAGLAAILVGVTCPQYNGPYNIIPLYTVVITPYLRPLTALFQLVCLILRSSCRETIASMT